MEGSGTELLKAFPGVVERRLSDAHLLLHGFQGDALSFRVKQEHYKEFQHHHGGEKYKGIGTGTRCHHGKHQGNEPVHKPVREAAQALAFGTHRVGKDFGEVDPDDGALGEGKKGDIADEQPDQLVLMLPGKKDGRNASQAERRAHRTHQQQSLAAKLINDRHGNDGEEQVGETDSHGLQAGGGLAVAGVGKNVVQVIKDGVDAGKLIEHADGNGQEDGQLEFAREQRLLSLALLEVNGFDDLLQVLFVVLIAQGAQDGTRLLDPALLNQPARAARNAKQQEEENDGGNGGDAEHPAPAGRSELRQADQVVRKIRQQNAEDHAELEEANQAAAQPSGRDFRNIHGAEHRGAANAQAADEAERHQSVPSPGEGAADGRDHVEHTQDAQAVAAAIALAGEASKHGAKNRAHQGAEHGNAQQLGTELIEMGKRRRGAGDRSEEHTSELQSPV